MKYRVLKDHLGLKEGQIVVEFHGYTYGLERDDERATGLPQMAVSSDGDNPFTIVPVHLLEPTTPASE